MFYFAFFAISWLFGLILADKTRWREILPVSMLAHIYATTTGSIMRLYPLWEYNGDDPRHILLNDFGLYIVVPYLFIQWLPRERTFTKMFMYWFFWTSVGISIEWIYVSTGHMRYWQWWNIGISYVADWILFCLFYKFHKLFKLKKLSSEKT